MTRRLFAVLALLSLPVLAGSNDVVITMSDGRTMQIDVGSPDTVDLIVEFRDVPLFSRMRALSTMDTANAMKTFDARFAQFAADVRPLQVTNTYERVFAGASVTVPRALVPQIARLSYVKHVFYDRTVHALADDDNIAKINADQVWATYGARGRGVVVAVIDTGIDYTHPALGGTFGPGARVIGGYDFVNKDTDPMDDNGHGTHVAGIIGANSDTLRGVAPEVSFLAYKALNAGGAGRTSDIVAAIERAADPDRNGNSSDHADVVNMSLGGPALPDDPLIGPVENATSVGVLFCIAAGNSGGFFNVSSPAVAPSAIAVGATDMNDRIAPFTSGGPDADNLAFKPEVSAPGVNIVSAAPGGGTIAHSGTSMATPHVAGVAALVKSLHPDWTPAEIKSAIVSTAVNIAADRMSQGSGRGDTLAACGVNAIASPAVISFGRDDSSHDRWDDAKTIGVTNRSNDTLTLTATTAPNSVPAGITLTVDPQSITLAPGEMQTVTVYVSVDNKQVAYPDQGSLTLSGAIVFTGSPAPMHVTWAFVKAARITAHYDTDESATLIVTGTGGSRTLAARPMPLGMRSADAYVPPGVYDAHLEAVVPASEGLMFRYVFAGRQTVGDSATIDFQSSSTGPSVLFASTDDQGRALSEIGQTPGVCYHTAYVVYPAGAPTSWSSITLVSRTGGRMRVASTAPAPGFSLTANESCINGSSLYIAQHGSLALPNAQSGTIAVDPSTWKRLSLRLLAPGGVVNPAVAFGPSTLTRTGSGLSSFPRTTSAPFSGKLWTGTLFITPELHDSVTTGGSLTLVGDLPNAPAVPFVDARVLRGTADGVLLSPYLTKGPTTYVAKSGESLMFGDSPVHPEMIALIDNSSFLAGGTWVGPLDESRTADALGTAMIVRDSSGAIVATQPPYKVPERGLYTAEMTNGAATLLARVDSRLSDAAAPVLRSLRILDDTGRETGFVRRGSRATLHFAALDMLLDSSTHTFTYALVNTHSATASWRLHGSPVWQPLALSVEATEIANGQDALLALGHPPAGVVFSTDLGTAAQVDGSVDLRLHVEDDSGNAIEYTVQNAFVVNEARRRAVRP